MYVGSVPETPFLGRIPIARPVAYTDLCSLGRQTTLTPTPPPHHSHENPYIFLDLLPKLSCNEIFGRDLKIVSSSHVFDPVDS